VKFDEAWQHVLMLFSFVAEKAGVFDLLLQDFGSGASLVFRRAVFFEEIGRPMLNPFIGCIGRKESWR